MYFPYLKLLKEESNAIKYTICSYADEKVIPIIEPCTDNEEERYKYKTLEDTIEALINKNKKFVLVVNSENDIQYLKSKLIDFDKYCIRGYHNNNRTVFSVPKQINIAVLHIDSINAVPDSANILYHIFMPEVLKFTPYLSIYPKNKSVKIDDGFKKHQPNSDYPTVEPFRSDKVFTFKKEGLAGFGDYTILEKNFEAASGGDADKTTHVIHLTRQQDGIQKLEVNHYLTTPDEEPDNRTRSKLTIEKAYNDISRYPMTKGIELIKNKYPNATSPAYYKRIGITHHIDLMYQLI